MSGARWAAAVVLFCAAACRDAAPPVTGKWERVDQPREWVRFEADHTFTAQSYMEPRVFGGRYAQEGSAVVVTATSGHVTRMSLADTLLVGDDGTRFRRAR